MWTTSAIPYKDKPWSYIQSQEEFARPSSSDNFRMARIRSEPRGSRYTARLLRCDLPEHSPLATIHYPRGRDEDYPTSTMFQRRDREFDRGELSDTSPVGLVSAARIGPRDPHFRVRAIVA